MATQLKPTIECSKEEWQARLDLAACYRIFDHLGWSESIYNHISLKVPGEADTFLINPFGLLYQRSHRAATSSRSMSRAIMSAVRPIW